MAKTPSYTINYNDKQFQEVEKDKNQAIKDNNKLYNNMINQSDSFYDKQIEASKEWADKQQQIQQEQTDFIIEKVEQNKEQAEKDYIKEQSGAYVDWQKQSNQYGANAEQQASQGMTHTGYSESSQVSMYNTYQNRVATARESFNKAILDYDNAIKEAQLANNAKLAEIAYEALQKQLELALQGFQYKNELLQNQANKKFEIEQHYYNRYLGVLNQLNTENALAENIRQYEENKKLQEKQLEEEKRQFNETMKYNREQSRAARASTTTSGGSSYSFANSNTNAEVVTDYYSGSKNPDCKYGTFKTTDKNGNRYQPNNVGGKKLSKSGLTIENNGVTQNVWKSTDGKYYYWEGRQNKYIQMDSRTVNGMLYMKNGKGNPSGTFR